MLSPAGARLLDSVNESRWIPTRLSLKQARLFLSLGRCREVLYGGAAGGGKSEALLAGAAMYADVPHFSAIIFRRTYSDLALSGALMDRAHEWWDDTSAHWNNTTKTWTFPSGARISFGYLQNPRDRFRYRSAEYQYIGFDELTDWPDGTDYSFLFSRLRARAELGWMPLRVWSASNPGGPGHQWVYDRFIQPNKPDESRCRFIPARLEDNPGIDEAGYRESLSYLDPYQRAQLEKGDWNAPMPGKLLRRGLFRRLEELPPFRLSRPVRYWDLAASAEPQDNDTADPDWSTGTKLAFDHTRALYVLDVQRFRLEPGDRDERMLEVAAADGRDCRVRVSQDPGQAGVSQIDELARMFAGYDFEGVRETGSKWVRAQPVASYAKRGLVRVLRGPWLDAWYAELEAFEEDEGKYAHDDQVDSFAGGFNTLISESGRQVRPQRPSALEVNPAHPLAQQQVGRRLRRSRRTGFDGYSLG